MPRPETSASSPRLQSAGSSTMLERGLSRHEKPGSRANNCRVSHFQRLDGLGGINQCSCRTLFGTAFPIASNLTDREAYRGGLDCGFAWAKCPLLAQC